MKQIKTIKKTQKHTKTVRVLHPARIWQELQPKRIPVAQVQCSSTENQSMRQWPNRTGAQRTVSGKDMVAIYQNSPAYGFNESFFVSTTVQ